MPRLMFPNDRTVFLYQGAGLPIRQPFESPLRVYLDDELTALADIQDTNQVSIAGSLIHIGEDGLLPDFYGPDDVTVLWIKAADAPAYPVVAKMAEYVTYTINNATRLNAPSAQRPSAVVLGVGAQIFDTTLNQPLWSDGVVWRDAGGVVVT